MTKRTTIRSVLAALLPSALVALIVSCAAGSVRSLDFSQEAPDVTITGTDAADFFSRWTAVGDVNGDGINDLIVGAFEADGPGASTPCGPEQRGERCSAGEVYVFYTARDLAADITADSADLTVFGAAASGYAGHAVAVGDINGDGTDDLVIGAYGADPAGRTDAGQAYVLYGAPDLPPTVDLATAADLTLSGARSGDNLGFNVDAGDINGDGFGDLLAGARLADTPGGEDAGTAYVIFGGPDLPRAIDLASTSADLTVLGEARFDELGFAVKAGDINGDGTNDLIIGAPAHPSRAVGPGKAYVIYGGPYLPTTIDLNSESADLAVIGDDPIDEFGRALAVGDLNGDGTSDLIIGANGADLEGRIDPGKVHVIFGRPDFPPTIDLAVTPADLVVWGDSAIDEAGRSVASGDVNGDSIDDLFIGAPGADPRGEDQAGRAYLVYGSRDMPARIKLRSGADLTVAGAAANDDTAYHVNVGDLDGDGTDDLLIAAAHADAAPDRLNAGKLRIIHGGPSRFGD